MRNHILWNYIQLGFTCFFILIVIISFIYHYVNYAKEKKLEDDGDPGKDKRHDESEDNPFEGGHSQLGRGRDGTKASKGKDGDSHDADVDDKANDEIKPKEILQFLSDSEIFGIFIIGFHSFLLLLSLSAILFGIKQSKWGLIAIIVSSAIYFVVTSGFMIDTDNKFSFLHILLMVTGITLWIITIIFVYKIMRWRKSHDYHVLKAQKLNQ